MTIEAVNAAFCVAVGLSVAVTRSLSGCVPGLT
jgi:hypothetical protein